MFVKTDFTNSIAKFIKSLHNAKKREENKLFLVEGNKCCSELVDNVPASRIDFVVINKSKLDGELLKLVEKFYKSGVTKIYEAQDNIFKNLTDTVTPQSILAVVKIPDTSIIKISNELPIVILDSISDPGNVGTIIRTADWFGVKQIILAGECAGQYSPKVVRSTMGSIFRVNILDLDYNSVKKIFSQKKFANTNVLAATLDAKKTLEKIKINNGENFCLIVGNESRGISAELKNIITEKFIISGEGEAESLNVAVACGISLHSLFGSYKKYNYIKK